MDRQPRAERLAALAALADPVRRTLYDHVADSASPVGRDAAAAALGLSRSTAAFHLDRLAGQGLLGVEYRRLGGRTGPGAGRPAKLYFRPDTEIGVSVPERRYDLAGELLAAALEESIRTDEPVRDVLVRTAHGTGRDIGAAAESFEAALSENGFEPRHEGDEIVLGNCPFHRLAQRFTALMCGLNLELLRGVAQGASDTSPDPGYDLRLDPAPGRCCVRCRTPGRRSTPA